MASRAAPVRSRSPRARLPATSCRENGRPIVAGIGISHASRPIFPALGVSKLDVARYFDRIADWIVPHVKGRPLTLVHCPNGVEGSCAFLRHAKAWGPSALRRVNIQEKTKVGEYLVADSIAGVVALAQMGIVEIHTWNSTADDVERPNRLVWDLDPGPAVKWAETAAAARLLRVTLETLGLQSWVKTTGGNGLHVVVPIVPGPDWSQCLAFARDLSEALVRTNARLYTTTFAKAGRARQILFDYLRNNRTNTSVCAYSPRVDPTGPVSTPVDWAELGKAPRRWTVLTIADRLKRLRRDPWHAYWTTRQRLTNQMVRSVGDL